MAFDLKTRSRPKREAGSPKPASKKKAFKTTKGAKYVLFVGDEGVILVYIKNNMVERRQFVPDTSQASLNEIRDTFDKDPKAPVMLAVDTLDQSYVQQTLPPVSSLSVNKLIKRRLDRDFAANDIKSALLLGREKSGRKDWNFLMIAVQKTPQLAACLDFIAELPNRFIGLLLVAVESEILLKALDTTPPGETPAEWKFLVAHNKVGGFRQVILRNDRVVFTRLAQPIGDSSPEVIAGNIEQEILSTIEYMKRMSFTVQAGLDIYIIGSSTLKGSINKSRFNASSVNILTPYEVAETLKIGGTQPNDQFADVILAAVIGVSRKHVLPLPVAQFKKANTLYQSLQLQRVIGALACLGMLGYIGSEGYDVVTALGKLDELTHQKDTSQQSLAALEDKIKNAHINVEEVSEMIDQYWQLLAEKMSPLPFIQRLAFLSDQPHVHIKDIEWALEQPAAPGGGKPASASALVPVSPLPDSAGAMPAPGNENITAGVNMEFATDIDDQKTPAAIAKDVLASFKEAYKGYDVKYAALPPSMVETENLNIDLGTPATPAPAPTPGGAAPEVKMVISGPASLEKAATAAAKGENKPALGNPAVNPVNPGIPDTLVLPGHGRPGMGIPVPRTQ